MAAKAFIFSSNCFDYFMRVDTTKLCSPKKGDPKMDVPTGIILGATLVIGGSVIGIFVTKTKGFGRFTTAVLLLTLVLYIGALAFAVNQLPLASLANLLFAIAGYAGGLLTAREKEPSESKQLAAPETEIN